ncbi:MAG: prephenate dehydrogenase/arogenate dehydrogenase family protein [Nitrospirota bacterium]
MNSESRIQNSKFKNTEKIFFDKVAILGVGLIGASFALALKEKGLCRDICGYGRKKENLKRAKDRGIIDGYSHDIREACKDADLIVLATPVGTFKDIISRIRDSMKQGAVVTDAGSVKGSLVSELEALMPAGVNYVGSHPIAGSDKSGIDDARADLFNNARCVITPTEKSDKDALQKVSSVWNAFGGKVEFMDPFKHDEIYAAVSHLPHILAYSLVNLVNHIDPDYIEHAGQGFKDATRIAMSSPELWRDISVYNRGNIIRLLEQFREEISKLEGMLHSSEASRLEDEFARAQALRKRIE